MSDKKDEKVDSSVDAEDKKSPTSTTVPSLTTSTTPTTQTSTSDSTKTTTNEKEKSSTLDTKDNTESKSTKPTTPTEKEKPKEAEKPKENEKDKEKPKEIEKEKPKEIEKEKPKEIEKEKSKEVEKEKTKEKEKPNEKTKLIDSKPLGDKNGPASTDKVQVTCETKIENDNAENNDTGKSKEDTVSTATTKAAEEKSTEETPLKGETTGKYQGVNARLTFAVCAAAFGSAFQHGYNLGVINAPLKLMEEWMNTTSIERTGESISKTQQTMVTSWIVSIYCIGGMIGGGATGFFSERYGRKGGLLINNVFAVAAAIFFGFCKMASSWEMIIVGRFLIGINNGLNAGLAPMYLSEIAPTNLRGAIGTVYQLVVTISILFSQIMGLESLLGTEELWPILLALTVLPAIFQICTLPICPESPKFLLTNKEQRMEAQRALTWLRDTSNVHEELEEIQNEAEAQKLVPKISLREIITNPALRIPLVIAVMMMLAQQLSGINAAIFFSVKIYEQAGLNEAESLYATIAMGTMNVLMTIVSLVLVERAGRKTLMITGLSGMMIDTILLTLCLVLQSESAKWLSYASIILVILFVVMFATGPGSIPWFLVNELFASNARPIASSIAVFVNWSAAFIVGLGFLPIQEVLGPYVFLVFTGILALFIVFTIKKVPETKGRSIDEITAVFKQQAYGGGINRV